MGLDFDLFRQSFIVLTQNNDDFFPAEMIGQFHIFRKHLTQHGAGEQHPVFFSVRAGTQRGHAVALMAVEGPVDFERAAFKGFAGFLRVRNFVKNGLKMEWIEKL